MVIFDINGDEDVIDEPIKIEVTPTPTRERLPELQLELQLVTELPKRHEP